MSSRVYPVAFLLLLSGMCALVFQTAWLREFRLIFGASTPASAAVLAIFMGGLGLGNAILGRRADRDPNPLGLYARLEMAISIASMISPFLVQFVRSIYIMLGGQETLGLYPATIIRIVLSVIVLGLPTFLMGGTLAAAARAVTLPDDHSRRDVGLLYGLNTLGAVLGAFLSTFFLLELFGTRATLWSACAINLLNALVAWKLSQRWGPLPAITPAATSEQKEPSLRQKREKVQPEPVTSSYFLYFAAGFIGFVFFLMELVWYRMLGPILGGTTFTFGLILAVALAGIGIGGALYPVIYRDRRPELRDFALTLGWEALAIAIPFALGDRLAMLAGMLRSMAYFGFWGQAIGWLAVTLIIVFPAALVSGVQFPVLIALIGRGSREVGKQLGQAFAWNTVGAMLGSLAGGFGLLPLLSAPGVWQAVVAALAIFGVAVILAEYFSLRRATRLVMPLAVAALSVACLTTMGPTAVWRHSGIGAGRARFPLPMQNEYMAWSNEARRSILWQADGQESSVAISRRSGAAFIVNGKSDGNAISDAGTQIMFPVVGTIIHPNPKSALVIGLGTGESAGWLANLPFMERVDVVELEPIITRMAEVCAPLNHDALNHPKVHLSFNDAREALQTTRQKYDLIASEPSNPYRSGVSSLYTREFYVAASRRLEPGGLFLQWLQGYEIDMQTVRTVLTTLREVFPHVEIWEARPADMLLVCSMEQVPYDLDQIRQRIAVPEVREAMRVGWRTNTVEGFLAHFVANHRYAAHVSARYSAFVNTDDKNILEYSFARTVGRSMGFNVAGLRAEAAFRDYHRPPQIDQTQVDWSIVQDQIVACYATIGDAPMNSAAMKGDQAKRAAAFELFGLGQTSGQIIAQWDSQKKPPTDINELGVIGVAYADLGNDKAKPLIEKLRPISTIEADALEGLLLQRQGKHAEAVERFERCFVALRRDPTPFPATLNPVFDAARQIADRDQQLGQRLFVALREPFAVYLFNDHRLSVLCSIARRLGPHQVAQAMEQLEPHVPWDEEMLVMRAEAYVALRHPLADKALSDLVRFHDLSPEKAVLMDDPTAPAANRTQSAPGIPQPTR